VFFGFLQGFCRLEKACWEEFPAKSEYLPTIFRDTFSLHIGQPLLYFSGRKTSPLSAYATKCPFSQCHSRPGRVNINHQHPNIPSMVVVVVARTIPAQKQYSVMRSIFLLRTLVAIIRESIDIVYPVIRNITV